MWAPTPTEENPKAAKTCEKVEVGYALKTLFDIHVDHQEEFTPDNSKIDVTPYVDVLVEKEQLTAEDHDVFYVEGKQELIFVTLYCQKDD